MAVKTNFTVKGYKYNRKKVTLEYDKNGKGIPKQFYGKSEKEVDKKIEEYKNMIESGLPTDYKKATFEQLFEVWLWDVLLPSSDFKSASFEKKETNFRLYIKNSPFIHLPVFSTSTLIIQKWYNDLYDNGVNTSKIFDINKTLRSFCNWCVNEHYLKENICSMQKIKIPGDADDVVDFDTLDDEDLWSQDNEGNNIVIFTDQEKKTIFENLKYVEGEDNTLRISILLDFCTGLRKGELLGFRKGLLNKSLSKLKVKKSLGNLKIFKDKNNYTRELRLKNTKSPSSIRIIDYAEELNTTLEKYEKEQKEKWKKNGLEFKDTSLYFTTNSCKPIDGTNYYRSYIRFLKRIGIKPRKFHAIRDTYCTDLFKNGATILEVRDLMGHSSIKITEKYYLFVYPEDRKKIANILSCYFKNYYS